MSLEEKERDEFIAGFDPSSFDDFSLFGFEVGRESYIAPFPCKHGRDGEWLYIVCLAASEVEDDLTITHELTECTIGRLIERLLALDKPLYLKRKQEDRFWVHGRQRKYLLEHMVTTLAEIGQVESKRLKERLAEEDFNELAE